MDRNVHWKDSEPDEDRFLDAVGPVPQCPHPDLVLSARAGALDEAAAQKVNNHAARCPVCSALLQGLEDPEITSIKTEEETRIGNVVFAGITRPQATARSRKWLWFAIPACAVGAAALFLILFVRREASPPPSLAQPAKAAQPKVVLALEKAAIQLPAAVLVFRRSDEPEAAYAQELTKALAPYKNDDYGQAIRELEPLARKYSGKAEASFYLGVSLLMAGRAGDAIAWLEKAKMLFAPDRNRDASWYLAVALERTGDSQRAAAGLQDLCRLPGPRQAEACAGAAAMAAR
jgi:hypothetical protein